MRRGGGGGADENSAGKRLASDIGHRVDLAKEGRAFLCMRGEGAGGGIVSRENHAPSQRSSEPIVKLSNWFQSLSSQRLPERFFPSLTLHLMINHFEPPGPGRREVGEPDQEEMAIANERSHALGK